jgi:hypothetical protein
LHVLVNHCFGMSILVITLNAFLSAAFTLYYAILDHSKTVVSDFITQPVIHTCHIAFLFVVLVTTCDRSNAIVSEHWKSPESFIWFFVDSKHQSPSQPNRKRCFSSSDKRVFSSIDSAPEILVHGSQLFWR